VALQEKKKKEKQKGKQKTTNFKRLRGETTPTRIKGEMFDGRGEKEKRDRLYHDLREKPFSLGEKRGKPLKEDVRTLTTNVRLRIHEGVKKGQHIRGKKRRGALCRGDF